MSLHIRAGRLAICGFFALIPFAPALADQGTAAACAAKLPAEARTIYQAAAPQVTPGTDLVTVLKSTTRSLVMNGKIARSGARPAARAAYPCLKQLQ
jgi:hypothetical protein